MSASQELVVAHTKIPGLLVLRMPLHSDSRGWFKENWQRAKMTSLGLPDFAPVQHSVAYNAAAGTTRGIHAEPWDKLVSLTAGKAFGAWVDLREGPTYGTVHTETLDETVAVFVPRGVGNSYQTLLPDTIYSYLVNAHWSPDAAYTLLNPADPTVAIPWPISLHDAVVSDKDKAHPELTALTPLRAPQTVILGPDGQLGRALSLALPDARLVSQEELDLADPVAVANFDFSDVRTVLNAAAYTAVDDAETDLEAAWATNATSLHTLARAALDYRFTLVHYSTDYVFDGTGGSGAQGAYRESDPIAPLSVYGQSKAAGELAVGSLQRHYLIRTSWVVGDGQNFVSTMRRLARAGVSPRVVNDQRGRLTFTDELARATLHLLSTEAAYGTYHVTNGGTQASWADIASWVFVHEGRAAEDVIPVSTAEYFAEHSGTVAPRPASSLLDISRICETGFTPADQADSLRARLSETTHSTT